MLFWDRWSKLKVLKIDFCEIITLVFYYGHTKKLACILLFKELKEAGPRIDNGFLDKTSQIYQREATANENLHEMMNIRTRQNCEVHLSSRLLLNVDGMKGLAAYSEALTRKRREGFGREG